MCERIPTIGTQLKILSTVKATMLGAQGREFLLNICWIIMVCLGRSVKGGAGNIYLVFTPFVCFLSSILSTDLCQFFHGFCFFSFNFIGGSLYATMMVPPVSDLCTHLILNGISLQEPRKILKPPKCWLEMPKIWCSLWSRQWRQRRLLPSRSEPRPASSWSGFGSSPGISIDQLQELLI